MGVPAPLPSGRTEVEIAADVVAQLLHAGLLAAEPSTVRKAAAATGVALIEIRRSFDVITSRGYQVPGRRPVLVPVGSAGPRPADGPEPSPGLTSGSKGHRSAARSSTQPPRRAWNKAPEDALRRCIRCRRVLPIECFQRRTDANSRRTTCDECRKAYQRERYVRVGARVVTVEVAAHDACVGRPCPRCGEPFRPGQRVQGDDVHHESCPRRGSAKAGAPR